MKQQIDQPLTACRLGKQLRHGRAYALERGLGRKKRDERIVLHGLTVDTDAAISRDYKTLS